MKIMRLNMVNVSIIYNCGTKFTFIFSGKLYKELTTQLTSNTFFNPKDDVQS